MKSERKIIVLSSHIFAAVPGKNECAVNLCEWGKFWSSSPWYHLKGFLLIQSIQNTRKWKSFHCVQYIYFHHCCEERTNEWEMYDCIFFYLFCRCLYCLSEACPQLTQFVLWEGIAFNKAVWCGGTLWDAVNVFIKLMEW